MTPAAIQAHPWSTMKGHFAQVKYDPELGVVVFDQDHLFLDCMLAASQAVSTRKTFSEHRAHCLAGPVVQDADDPERANRVWGFAENQSEVEYPSLPNVSAPLWMQRMLEARRLCMTVVRGRGSSNAYLFKGMVVSISANIDCNHDLNSYSYG
ncbi:unnamed protein product [Symbiodinium sp. CCMP2592]|nr:unnamed protein product [Symbiodinium sp. CCMP2592]